jgi:hypothetical protein
MKTSWIIVFSLLALWSTMAKAELCRSIRSDKERLACFDREITGSPANKRQTSKTIAKPEQAIIDPVDWLKAENEKLSMRLKAICRGC